MERLIKEEVIEEHVDYSSPDSEDDEFEYFIKVKVILKEIEDEDGNIKKKKVKKKSKVRRRKASSSGGSSTEDTDSKEKKSSFLDKYKQKSPGGGGSMVDKYGKKSGPPRPSSSSSMKDKLKPPQEDKVSLLDREKRKQSKNVYLVRGKDKDKPAWHFVHVETHKIETFHAQIKTGTIDVADFGKVLFSGWGKDPPQDIIDQVDIMYGYTPKKKDEDEDKKKDDDSVDDADIVEDDNESED